jgi:uncharacterized repeat protein (TIGR03803 family)
MALLLGARLLTQAQGFLPQHTFTGPPDGAGPQQVTFTNGLFYGSTLGGGTNSDGTIFTFNTNGLIYSEIYSFTGPTNGGTWPNDVLVLGNRIYGTTQAGGTNYEGLIYSVGTDGSGFRPLYSFGTSPDGAQPQSGLTAGSGGVLYGTAYNGGSSGGGTIFKINTNGTGYGILHSFTNNPEGAQPEGELVFDGGMLYGITTYGGVAGRGTVFALSTNGNVFITLHSFTNTPEPIYPHGGLVLSAGVLYGTGSSGGANTNGAIFAIGANGSGYRVLYDLAGDTDGKVPEAKLTLAGRYLYGTCASGGANGGGTLFLIDTNGNNFSVIASFTNGFDSGWDPLAGAYRIGHDVWGTTSLGGANTHGTLYRVVMPAILAQPQSLSVTNTGSATFMVNAVDDSPISYRWYFNTNTLLAGQNTNVLTLPRATNENSGTYTAVLTDSAGSVTSSPAVLNVVVTGVKPVITQNPQSLSVVAGSSASFTNTATGSPPLYYQWYLNATTLLSGKTNAILVIPSASNSLAGYYSVIVTNLYGSATSTPALLTVQPGVAPTITQQAHDFTVTNGLTATFTNVASGTEPIFYRWFFDANTPVSSGTDQTVFTISSATSNQDGYYTTIVSNQFGTATSAPARLTVIVPISKPVFTQQPQDESVTNGYDALFTNVASSTLPITYQWYFNTNTAIAGGTNAILTVGFVSTNDAGYYTVVVSSSAGSVTSAPARLTIISTKPIIFLEPQPAIVNDGDTFSFTVVAAGEGPLRYNWYTNIILNAKLQRNETTSTLTGTAKPTLSGLTYIVIVTNSLGKATSSPPALLTVVTKPIIIQQPDDVVVTNGDPFGFTAAAMGPGTLSYQWFFDTNSAISGATGTSLSYSNATAALAGHYSLRAVNSYGAVTSRFALLVVSNQLRLLNFSFDAAAGSPSFALANLIGSTNRLWATTNLADAAAWQVVGSNVMDPNGLWFYTETNSARTNAIRLYRFSSP